MQLKFYFNNNFILLFVRLDSSVVVGIIILEFYYSSYVNSCLMKGLLSTYSSLENGAIDMVHPNAFSDPIVVEVLKQFILEYVTE